MKEGKVFPYVESLRHALFYHNVLGFTVIPEVIDVEEQKRVYPVKWGVFRERKQSEEDVRELFTRFRGANVAVILGRPSNVVVIDVDGREIPSFLQKIDTWVVATRRGYHFYFRCPIDEPVVETRVLMEKVELKGEGSLVTLPRSYHPKDMKVRYEWVVPPMKNIKKRVYHVLADFSVVRDRLAVYYIKKNEKEVLRDLYRGVPEGKRNVSLARIAGSLFHDGLEFDEVVAILLAVNKYNEPPLDRKEVISIAKSIYKRDLRRRESYSRLEEKFYKMIVGNVGNGVREEIKKHLEKIKGEMKKSGFTERDVVMFLKRLNFYDLYCRLSDSEEKIVKKRSEEKRES